MARKLPPPSGPARMETNAYYYREGRRMLQSAIAAFPGHGPIEALVKHQKGAGPLDPSSLPVYRGNLRRIVTVLLRRDGKLEAFEDVWLSLDAALSARKNKAARGSDRTGGGKKRKVEDATEEEAAALFVELKEHGLKSGNMNAVLAGLFTLVAGHSGFRPVELMGAELSGTILSLPNAKRRKGQADSRLQNLGNLHGDVLIGLGLLIGLIDPGMSRRQFRAWEKCLAEQMRRACIRIGIRELAPYSFRHIAIATWSRAGLSPQEIAHLCGHTSIRTAHTHYARAAAGHKRKTLARADTVPSVEREIGNTPDQAATEEGALHAAQQFKPVIDFAFDDMPTPKQTPRTGPEPMSPEAVAAALAQYDPGVDASAVGHRIREAQQRRRNQASDTPDDAASNRKEGHPRQR
jgi:integrase